MTSLADGCELRIYRNSLTRIRLLALLLTSRRVASSRFARFRSRQSCRGRKAVKSPLLIKNGCTTQNMSKLSSLIKVFYSYIFTRKNVHFLRENKWRLDQPIEEKSIANWLKILSLKLRSTCLEHSTSTYRALMTRMLYLIWMIDWKERYYDNINICTYAVKRTYKYL